jgi:phage replication-related protein YjqB (UPF0714/DUF867 family)
VSEDKYKNFDALRKSEKPDVDYRIRVSSRDLPVAIIAPHGGKIEKHTSDIAAAIADDDFSSYMFEGIKKSGNWDDLHITSHNFDEPQCLALIGAADTVVAIHGRGNAKEAIGVGGRDIALRDAVCLSLKQAGFKAGIVESGPLSATDKNNICNRGRSKKGVQLEITEELRNDLKGERLKEFANAVRKAIGDRQ